jgi:hypothetical protein
VGAVSKSSKAAKIHGGKPIGQASFETPLNVLKSSSRGHGPEPDAAAARSGLKRGSAGGYRSQSTLRSHNCAGGHVILRRGGGSQRQIRKGPERGVCLAGLAPADRNRKAEKTQFKNDLCRKSAATKHRTAAPKKDELSD